MKWKWWTKPKKQTETLTKTEGKTEAYSKAEAFNQNRTIADVRISYVEGISGTSIIEVTGWNKDEALDLFHRVREEVKHK